MHILHSCLFSVAGEVPNFSLNALRNVFHLAQWLHVLRKLASFAYLENLHKGNINYAQHASYMLC